MDEKSRQLVSETDRGVLREYLEKRLKDIKRKGKRAGEREEAAFWDGAEMEIICIYDELLGEQPPELLKKVRAH